MIAFLLIVIALLAYFCGGINSALTISRLVFKEDIRRLGSRNASFANFVQVYGQSWGMAAIALDVIKTAVPALLGMLILKIPGNGYEVIGILFAGFCAVLGDCYPWRFRFRGARGIPGCLTALTMADWRAGLVACIIYVVVLAFSRMASLAGMVAALSGSVLCWAFVDTADMKGLAGLLALFMALVILFRQRKTFGDILSGRESQIRWGRQADEKMRDDRF